MVCLKTQGVRLRGGWAGPPVVSSSGECSSLRAQVDELQPGGRAASVPDRCRCACRIPARERVGALLHHLAGCPVWSQIHHHPGLLGPNGQIIAPPTAGMAPARRAPVREGRRGRHLEGAQHADIRWPPRIIAKLSAWWKYATGQQRHGLFASVDQVVVFVACGGRGLCPECRSRFGMTSTPFRDVVGPPGWGLADASRFTPGTVVDVLRHAAGQFVFFVLIVAHACSFCAKGAFLSDFLKPPAWVAVRSIFTTWHEDAGGDDGFGVSCASSTIVQWRWSSRRRWP